MENQQTSQVTNFIKSMAVLAIIGCVFWISAEGNAKAPCTGGCHWQRLFIIKCLLGINMLDNINLRAAQ